MRLSVHFNKLLDVINVVLFYKEIQSKSFLSTLLGNLNIILTKVKANSQEHKASEWEDNLPVSLLGSVSLSRYHQKTTGSIFFGPCLGEDSVLHRLSVISKNIHCSKPWKSLYLNELCTLLQKRTPLSWWKDAIWKLFIWNPVPGFMAEMQDYFYHSDFKNFLLVRSPPLGVC